MRDIVFRKVVRPEEPVGSVLAQPDNIPTPLQPDIVAVKPDTTGLKRVSLPDPELNGAERVIYGAAHALSSIAGTILHTVSRGGVVHREILTPQQGVLPKKKSVKKLGAPKKKSPTKGKRHRNVTIANTLAVLVLLAISGLNYQQSSEALKNASQTATSTTSSSVRQYLPNIAKSTASNPLSSEDLRQLSENTSLHAWVAPWNTSSVGENAAIYSSVSAFWLSLESDGYTVVPKADWSGWTTFAAGLTASKRFLTISADPDFSFIALTNTEVQEKLIANLLTSTKAQGFTGIDINFEALGEENRDLFTSFIRNLTAAFSAENLKVAVTVEARLANQMPMDWRNLSLIADEVRVMVYDYHASSTGTPGPIAPLGWLKEILDYTQANTKSEKVVIGLGNYGYDWIAPTEPGELWEGLGISHERATALALEKSTPIIQQSGIDERGYDIGTAPSFTYTDEQGARHDVWFEDQASLAAKLNLIAQYRTAGVIFWSVGLGDTAFWTKQHEARYTSRN